MGDDSMRTEAITESRAELHWVGPMRFQEALVAERLQVPGVYLWLWGVERKSVVYVGETKDVVHRFSQHLENYSEGLGTFVNPVTVNNAYRVLTQRDSHGRIRDETITQRELHVPGKSTAWDCAELRRLSMQFLRECYVMVAQSEILDRRATRRQVEALAIRSLVDEFGIARTPNGKAHDYLIGQATGDLFNGRVVETAEFYLPDLGQRWNAICRAQQ